MSKRITRKRFRDLISSGDIATLFNELGWDHADDRFTVEASKARHELHTVANKRGFAVVVHTADQVPDRSLRQSIEKKVARIHFEHLIVFRSADGAQQVWQLAIRRPNQPVTYHEATWHKGQEPELLYQKLSGLFIPLEAEDSITLVDVSEQVTAQFERNTKEVTKKFYREFSAQHKDFLKFIKGIQEQVDQEWYASLMLNRLMFIYFIQKKGFLNGDRDYLQNKLKESKQKRGANKFYTFYRDFLLVLFHQGLGSPTRSAELLKEIGKVPYLNGGLFDVHDLEKNHPIEVGDKAFENLFAFFDTWNWHLDTRASSSGRDVNPDVIGYIFEQYINDRAQMGAYYTKEDITEYISKNTIIPWLFDAAKAKDAQAFKAGGGVWVLLQEEPDRYIHRSLKHGVDPALMAQDDGKCPWWRSPIFNDLPDDVRKGLDPEQNKLSRLRKACRWSTSAPADKALPTEIWREVIDRRRRYLEVRRKLVAGEVTAINDLITYNLDIRQFAQDVIHEYEGSDLVGAFYDAISRITVLDPTCGSGAFLFAALGILQPLYEQCLDRMQWFVEVDNEKGSGKKHPEFRKVLDRMKQHPNRDYFIYKSIILQNLYGVDIMREAVEIAKLRLSLKLVSTVDPDPRQENYGIEPLPDIDFNIRSGNTLVGFGTKAELVKGLTYTIDGLELKPVIEEHCERVSMAYDRFRQKQLDEGEDPESYYPAKQTLQAELTSLRDELDKYLGKQYGKNAEHKGGKEYAAWKKSHQPFHWFAEYYGILEGRGGFDVIIGNPPYVAIHKIDYEIMTEFKATDLYAYVIDRCLSVLSLRGKCGMIVMHNLAFSRDFAQLRKKLRGEGGQQWYSFFARIPSGLFSGDVRVRNCIALLHRGKAIGKGIYHTTRIHRWFADNRPFLFESLRYTQFSFTDVVPMFDSPVLRQFYESSNADEVARYMRVNSPSRLFFKQNAYNWVAISHTPAPCFDTRNRAIEQTQVASVGIEAEETKHMLLASMNTRWFTSYWLTYGDEFHVTKDDLGSFRLPLSKLNRVDKSILVSIGKKFERQLPSTIQYKYNAGKYVGTYRTSSLWDLTEEAEELLLKYCTATPEEVLEAIELHLARTLLTVPSASDALDRADADNTSSTESKATKAKPPKAAAAKTLRQAQGGKKDDPDPFV